MPFTCTIRNQPSRIICAIPSASFRSVLLRIALSELCMCRVSTTITGCSIAFSSRQPDADRRRLDADPDDPFMVRQHRANGVGIGRPLGFAEPLEIGRASWRESVCQSGEILRGGGYLKKKK